MPGQHKHKPVAYRPPEDVRGWLLPYCAGTGRAVNAVITQALRECRERNEKPGAELAISGADAQALLRHAVASMTELQRKAKDDPVYLPSARSAADLAARLRRFTLDNPGCDFALRPAGGEPANG